MRNAHTENLRDIAEFPDIPCARAGTSVYLSFDFRHGMDAWGQVCRIDLTLARTVMGLAAHEFGHLRELVGAVGINDRLRLTFHVRKCVVHADAEATGSFQERLGGNT